ncbi:MAG TPA: amidohydrolase family protein [Bradyrhizobium sp.]|jgi:cytosine/adenosine deaminase-related metal-dependent hydrolase|nr:amidohydrolase family protein [Bradyrhizobium sp.]
MCQICRRDFIRGAAAFGTSGLFASPLMAQTQRGDAGASRLPPRGEFTIANAYVMTMDGGLGDIANASVHVRNGEIAAVGKDVGGGGEKIDGAGMIVMPGLVETHWHMWNTIFRSFAGDKPEEGYFPTVARFGQQVSPEDVFQSTRLSAAEAINSGMTFVHSWCHNVRSTAHAEADVRALAEAGIRARHSCGWPQGLPDTQSADQAPLENLARDWKSRSNDGLITLGMAWRGQFRAGPIKPEVYQPEFDNARKLGLPITVHVAAAAHRAVGQIELLYKAKLLGKDIQLVHALAASDAELDMIKESGAAVSVSPGSELRIGYGYPQVSEMLAKGIPLGISVDTSALTGSSNMFGVLKLTRDSENAKAESEFKMTARKALELGTIGGARSMGIDNKVGSLTPGKRADLIAISPNALNMAVVSDPAHLVLEATGPENVDTVVVDGRILKRGGKLTALDTSEIIAGARAALAGVRERTKWR